MKDPLDRYHRPADSALDAVVKAQNQVSANVGRDSQQREMADTLLRGQAERGTLPLPTGQKDAVPLHKDHRTVALTDAPQTIAPQQPGRTEDKGLSKSGEPVQTQPAAQDPELASQMMRTAGKGLATLAKGGAHVKLPDAQAATPQQTPQQATPQQTPQQATLRNALIASILHKKTPQAPSTQIPPSRTPAADPKIVDKAVATPPEPKGGHPEVAGTNSQFVAQKMPPPFANTDDHKSYRDKIGTDDPTARAMDNVVTGRGVAAIATAQEFSAGGQGGFGDPDGDSPGLAQKVSAVPLCPYGESEDYGVETNELCKHLVYSGILGGGEPMQERIRVAIGDRIANTQDDTSLELRVQGSPEDHSQIAEGTRGSVIGPGRIVA